MEIITRNKLLLNRATDKELKIFNIAVKTLKVDRCTAERFETARKCLYWLTRINNAREIELEYDSFENGQKIAKRYALKIKKMQEHLNRETRFPSVARASRECNPYARRTTITVKYQPIGDNMPLTYTYTFNFNDKTDF